jgi:hypothetical protein
MNLFLQIEQLVNALHATSHEDTNEHFNSILENAKNDILSGFHTMIYSLDGKVEQYVKIHQHQLLQHMENIADNHPAAAFTIQAEEPSIQLYYTLYDLLGYLEMNCATYLDFHCNVPIVYLLSAREIFRKEIPLLYQALSSFGVDDSVQAIILAPFNKIMEAEKVSFQRIHYLNKLNANLQQLPTGSSSEDVERTLLFMNFNNTRYLQYKLNVLADDIEALSTVQQQLMQTKLQLKITMQQLQHPNYRYTCKYPSLKEQLCDWLTHESSYLEQKMLYPDDTLLPEEIVKWTAFKLKLNLSVIELGYLIRLMVEQNLILNENRSDVADFFAQHFATNNSSSISGESLRKKMYNYPTSSVKSIRNHLIDLINKSKQMEV